LHFVYDITDIKDYDVFIAGGGPAGVSAAVTCARTGKRVYLAESSGAFGGCGTVGMVPEFMNFDDGENFLAGGIGYEIASAMLGNFKEYNREQCVVDTEKLKLLYDKLMLESGADFNFFTTLIALKTDGSGRVEYAVLSSCGKIFAVRAKVFIDCTGNGDLCVMAGAQWKLGGNDGLTMPATLCSLWADVDFQSISGRDDSHLDEAIADGVIPVNDKLLPGIKHIKGSVGGGNIGHCFSLNPTDTDAMTAAMLYSRSLIRDYEKYYRQYLTGYENMFLCATANMLGVRESRRIVGDETLLNEHYDSCAVFENEIGRYSYFRDIHTEQPTTEAHEIFLKRIGKRHGRGESYGIPYGVLTPKGLKNVLTAGKCISTDRHMQSSVRVVPGCYITGQASGMAAALACECGGDVRGFGIAKLQQSLKSVGAFLPNCKL